MKESQGERAVPRRKKGESEREQGEERVGSTMKEGRFQGGDEGQARRASRGEVGEKHKWVSGRKSSPGRSRVSWFHFKFGQT